MTLLKVNISNLKELIIPMSFVKFLTTERQIASEIYPKTITALITKPEKMTALKNREIFLQTQMQTF